MQMKPSPAPEPFDPTSWMKDVEGDHYAYVPRNPNADMNTDDLVALPWGKRTLYKPAGLMVYFSPEEEEHYEYYVANGCYIQGLHRPVQPISRSRAQKLSSGSNVDAARDMSFHRERLLRGAKQELRVFSPWYSRPRTSSLQESAVPDGFYLCRMCKSPLNAATAGPAAAACPNGCVRP